MNEGMNEIGTFEAVQFYCFDFTLQVLKQVLEVPLYGDRLDMTLIYYENHGTLNLWGGSQGECEEMPQTCELPPLAHSPVAHVSSVISPF